MGRIPVVLKSRLGEEASSDLVEWVEAKENVWSDKVLNLAVERFERRLSETIGPLRVDLAQMESRLLKWSFLFWVGQVAVMAGLLAFMLRASGR